jgi:hypothetical protein
MSAPIDPIRRAGRPRRALQAGAERAEAPVETAGLPVPVEPPRTLAAAAPTGAATFDAQLLGQGGEKRGLRAGPAAIQGAQHSYNRAEWSGAKDRRRRKGAIARTEI